MPDANTARTRLDAWFERRGWSPFAFQREVWAAYLAGESGLIHAATGTGKTYAAWLGPLLEWMETHEPDPRPWRRTRRAAAPPLRVLWLTPLRALAADTEAALRAPLAGLGLPWTLERRTGDTSASVRDRQREKLPTALVTTPESLSLLLSRPDARELFADLACVVVDEWHELLGSKRGVQTELALARLRRFRPALRTWGLSATLGNLDAALAALLGVERRRAGWSRGAAPKEIRDRLADPADGSSGSRGPATSGSSSCRRWSRRSRRGRTALVFTNTRSQTEMWYQAILAARPDWAGRDRPPPRLARPQGARLRGGRPARGRLRCVVCTSSLDLGVDFSPVDRVLQVGSPKGVARLLQRAGRSGHRPGAPSRVTCVPTNAFELVEVAAARERRWRPGGSRAAAAAASSRSTCSPSTW